MDNLKWIVMHLSPLKTFPLSLEKSSGTWNFAKEMGIKFFHRNTTVRLSKQPIYPRIKTIAKPYYLLASLSASWQESVPSKGLPCISCVRLTLCAYKGVWGKHGVSSLAPSDFHPGEDFHSPLLESHWSIDCSAARPANGCHRWQQASSGCRTKQVKAPSREVLVQRHGKAELQSLHVLATSSGPPKKEEWHVWPIYDVNTNFLESEKLKTICSQEGMRKQQCDAGSNELTNPTRLFKGESYRFWWWRKQ